MDLSTKKTKKQPPKRAMRGASKKTTPHSDSKLSLRQRRKRSDSKQRKRSRCKRDPRSDTADTIPKLEASSTIAAQHDDGAASTSPQLQPPPRDDTDAGIGRGDAPIDQPQNLGVLESSNEFSSTMPSTVSGTGSDESSDFLFWVDYCSSLSTGAEFVDPLENYADRELAPPFERRPTSAPPHDQHAVDHPHVNEESWPPNLSPIDAQPEEKGPPASTPINQRPPVLSPDGLDAHEHASAPTNSGDQPYRIETQSARMCPRSSVVIDRESDAETDANKPSTASSSHLARGHRVTAASAAPDTLTKTSALLSVTTQLYDLLNYEQGQQRQRSQSEKYPAIRQALQKNTCLKDYVMNQPACSPQFHDLPNVAEPSTVAGPSGITASKTSVAAGRSMTIRTPTVATPVHRQLDVAGPPDEPKPSTTLRRPTTVASAGSDAAHSLSVGSPPGHVPSLWPDDDDDTDNEWDSDATFEGVDPRESDCSDDERLSAMLATADEQPPDADADNGAAGPRLFFEQRSRLLALRYRRTQPAADLIDRWADHERAASLLGRDPDRVFVVPKLNVPCADLAKLRLGFCVAYAGACHMQATCPERCAGCGVCVHMYMCTCRVKNRQSWCLHLHMAVRNGRHVFGDEHYAFVHFSRRQMQLQHIRSSCYHPLRDVVPTSWNRFSVRPPASDGEGGGGGDGWHVVTKRRDGVCDRCPRYKRCPMCDICRHTYDCTCDNYVRRRLLCDHCHAVRQSLLVDGSDENFVYGDDASDDTNESEPEPELVQRGTGSELYAKITSSSSSSSSSLAVAAPMEVAAVADTHVRRLIAAHHEKSYAIQWNALRNDGGVTWLVAGSDGIRQYRVTPATNHLCLVEGAECASCEVLRECDFVCTCGRPANTICKHKHAVFRRIRADESAARRTPLTYD